ncbi:biotin--[acetyl-CoA-carboxylase] ligase [Cellulosilyticum sp. WCF-2]|uniref:biotin--[acetyl-CoA-carboxylase] ligase n=1 Tax=Cellulosilyticum sp. WCF-2 TaxID=2497860 RepID=UPI000F8CE6CA|nr:biotin--[acetyl-CoA-carboxylase] ligase [Cellulosilyticum sp. WCF-2]QEH67619.1 biotin--[acetyl-CoA-carboxylase] ligase [Cellulosilyticum sp. WCF-2]
MVQGLDIQKVKAMTTEKWFNKQLFYLAEVTSTNDWIKKQGQLGKLEGTLLVADQQTAGRGSHGRSWESPTGTGLWFSFLLRPNLEPGITTALAPLVAYSLVATLKEDYHLPVAIKWPNDVIINGKKLAGILTEIETDGLHIKYVTVGVGINVNMQQMPGAIAQKATSLFLETKKIFQREQLLVDFMIRFCKDYQQFCKEGSLKSFIASYNKYLFHYDKKIWVLRGEQKEVCKSLGIKENGNLEIEGATGKQSLCMGEVSLRGEQAYI